MMHVNPYADEILEECGGEIEDLRKPILAILSVQHELSETRKAEAARAAKMVELTERAIATAERLVELTYAPPRFVLGNQDPIAPEDLKAKMRSTKLMAVPDDSGDARIAAAARRWAEAYGNRNMPGKAAAHHLASSELLEVVRQEDER